MIRLLSTLLLMMSLSATPAHAFSLSELFGSGNGAVEFKWQDAAGKEFSIAQMRGKPVLVHLWASWCPSCRDEMPAFNAWLQQHPEVAALTVSLDSNAAEANAYLQDNDLNLPVLITDEAQARKLGAQSLPTTVVIAADGTVSQFHRGPRNWHDQRFSDNLLQSLSKQN